ncbi:hypothetical protein IWQ60_008495 [Tieghemiomyces parasiticus]|uniref:VHS domain-containing protein n=1 Tax=Tieghemiomyces parasiticus TaxID=78921 RepID=A0A9W7ZYD6_9FUNG|nr:hypothetical protein IWQ60_008495 [Tieghemiomyces parasiticus]
MPGLRTRWSAVLGLLRNKLETHIDQAIENPAHLAELLTFSKTQDPAARKTTEVLVRRLWSSKLPVALGSLMIINALVDDDAARMKPALVSTSFTREFTKRTVTGTAVPVLRDSLINSLRHWYAAYPGEDTATFPLLQALETAKQSNGGHAPPLDFLPRPLVADRPHYGVFGAVMLAPVGEYVPPEHRATANRLPSSVADPQSLVNVGQYYATLLRDALINISPETDQILTNEVVKEFVPKCREIHQTLVTNVQRATASPTDRQMVDTMVTAAERVASAVHLYVEILDSYNLYIATEKSKAEAPPTFVLPDGAATERSGGVTPSRRSGSNRSSAAYDIVPDNFGEPMDAATSSTAHSRMLQRHAEVLGEPVELIERANRPHSVAGSLISSSSNAAREPSPRSDGHRSPPSLVSAGSSPHLRAAGSTTVTPSNRSPYLSPATVVGVGSAIPQRSLDGSDRGSRRSSTSPIRQNPEFAHLSDKKLGKMPAAVFGEEDS